MPEFDISPRDYRAHGSRVDPAAPSTVENAMRRTRLTFGLTRRLVYHTFQQWPGGAARALQGGMRLQTPGSRCRVADGGSIR